MKAGWYKSFGPASEVLVLGQLPVPKIEPGQILVRMETSGVNPSDTKKRAGIYPNLLDNGLIIPHSDGAGVIEEIGDDVDASRIGERVWIYQAQHARRFGTGAEYVTIENNRAPFLPDEASFEVGACLGIPAMTAHRCVFADGPVSGQTVLITGGAGRVGFYAIQWAKFSGGRVIATASNQLDEQTCIEVGADYVVNHRRTGWPSAVLDFTDGEKVDRVIDVEFGENLPKVLECVRVGGTIVSYSSSQVAEPKIPFRRMLFLDLTIRLVLVYEMPEEAKQRAVSDIMRSLKRNQLRHRISNVVGFDDMPRSHELIEQGGVRGCVIVSITDSDFGSSRA